ncbi:FtsQ-type POTRA domain-containing protein [Agreia pratensis]|uniref:Cell division septal protein FtsQ n=1 Tax=Agreia pratensis TaxID=150121 RepID=A0A1X7L6I3_9MICO|nr:FtsQ-type POTRA domain-containing protein [Agreia pratensis]SMG49345.1 Cell division septal protein FtsQ [Agreia pratensis]
MKRPPGVTPPPAGPPEAERPNEPRAAEPRRRAPGGIRRSKKKTSSEVEAITEPIDIVSGSASTPEASSGFRSLPPLPEVSLGDGRDSGRDDDDDSSPKPWWLTRRTDPTVEKAAEAEKNLAHAERRRRRYERAEARRFTQATRTRRRKYLMGLAATVVLVLVVVLTAYSPLLAVRTITVEGASRVDASAVSAALDDQLGRPLTLVDFGEVKKTLETFPLIQSYVTEARPPDTLVIRIVERRPVVTVAADGAFNLVDAAGVVVETTPARAPGYPTIDVAATPVDSPGFAAASQVLLALSPEFLAQVDAVSAPTPDSVTLALTNGQRVVWGSAEDSALKARIVASMISNPGIPDVTEYDVSSPEAPIVH